MNNSWKKLFNKNFWNKVVEKEEPQNKEAKKKKNCMNYLKVYVGKISNFNKLDTWKAISEWLTFMLSCLMGFILEIFFTPQLFSTGNSSVVLWIKKIKICRNNKITTNKQKKNPSRNCAGKRRVMLTYSSSKWSRLRAI